MEQHMQKQFLEARGNTERHLQLLSPRQLQDEQTIQTMTSPRTLQSQQKHHDRMVTNRERQLHETQRMQQKQKLLLKMLAQEQDQELGQHEEHIVSPKRQSRHQHEPLHRSASPIRGADPQQQHYHNHSKNQYSSSPPRMRGVSMAQAREWEQQRQLHQQQQQQHKQQQQKQQQQQQQHQKHQHQQQQQQQQQQHFHNQPRQRGSNTLHHNVASSPSAHLPDYGRIFALLEALQVNSLGNWSTC